MNKRFKIPVPVEGPCRTQSISFSHPGLAPGDSRLFAVHQGAHGDHGLLLEVALREELLLKTDHPPETKASSMDSMD